MHSGRGEVAEQLVKIALVVGDGVVGYQGARFGEWCAFPCVVAFFEFAVGGVEVIRIETGLIGEPSVITHFAHVEIARLVPRIIRPAAPGEVQACAAHSQSAPIELAVLIENALGRSPQRGDAANGVTAELSPVVEHKRVRVAADRTVDVSSTARADDRLCQSRLRGS